MSAKHKKTVVEKFLLLNPMWQEGFRNYSKLFGRPQGWLFLIQENGDHHVLRLDRKGNAGSQSKKRSVRSCGDALLKYGAQLSQDEDSLDKLPTTYKCVCGKTGAIFSIRHLGRVRGIFFLCSLHKNRRENRDLMTAFDHFLATHVELAYKTFELNNFYETVHPRALALSTMHSVHRVISSSLRLNELLPRIGRLSAQVLKASGCSIMLTDMNREYLLPLFSFGENASKYVHRHRVRIGRGLEGRIAKTGDFYLSRKVVGVPFIEDDVVGVMTLWEKMDKQPFIKTDLEILKSLSEQAVVAIKNAQLYEETQQLTLGSIKTINDLMELNFGTSRGHLSILGELVLEVGKELKLSGHELENLQRAIMLLDAGAMALPEQVWKKKGKLTKKEFELIKRIPMRGANLLSSISSLKPVIPIILHHRERYDGQGYPRRLKGEEIPIGARIVSVVDSLLAMISERAYRAPKSVNQAIAEIKQNRNTQFDPEVVDAMLKVLAKKEVLAKIKKFQATKITT